MAETFTAETFLAGGTSELRYCSSNNIVFFLLFFLLFFVIGLYYK